MSYTEAELLARGDKLANMVAEGLIRNSKLQTENLRLHNRVVELRDCLAELWEYAYPGVVATELSSKCLALLEREDD